MQFDTNNLNNLNNSKIKFITLKEFVEEIKNYSEVNSCKNIIHFYDIIRVMEYADSGTLTWENKINIPIQSSHDEGIVHRDLHSKNIAQNLGLFRGCLLRYFPYSNYKVSAPIPNTPEDYVKIYTDLDGEVSFGFKNGLLQCFNSSEVNRFSYNAFDSSGRL
ncbi:kinase-like domain-containing protein [Rhizophagus clarus]|uniref:Kinase-like domain-containing protein n=1 Tax=Rhizophagus clarus TaxID=94130 RepID=A0A8H3LB40_9GLOM|nr:kinase-like domain-containing protein [Rhizophagus clarus]